MGQKRSATSSLTNLAPIGDEEERIPSKIHSALKLLTLFCRQTAENGANVSNPTLLLTLTLTLFFVAGMAFGVSLAFWYVGPAARLLSPRRSDMNLTAVESVDSFGSFVMPTMHASRPMFLRPISADRGPLTEILDPAELPC